MYIKLFFIKENVVKIIFNTLLLQNEKYYALTKT